MVVPMLALQLSVSGRVQGVGFRWWAQGVARQLGLAGRVRNLPDGRVEIVVQGEPDSVRTLLRLAIEVPTTTSRPGWVDDYEMRWVDPVPGRLGFFTG
jgi:acylphosphatase